MRVDFDHLMNFDGNDYLLHVLEEDSKLLMSKGVSPSIVKQRDDFMRAWYSAGGPPMFPADANVEADRDWVTMASVSRPVMLDFDGRKVDLWIGKEEMEGRSPGQECPSDSGADVAKYVNELVWEDVGPKQELFTLKINSAGTSIFDLLEQDEANRTLQ